MINSKRYYTELKLDRELKWSEVTDIYNELEGTDYDNVRDMLKRDLKALKVERKVSNLEKSLTPTIGNSEVVEGKEESKSNYEETELGYRVYYGDNYKVDVTDRELEEMFALYCVANLNIEQVCLQCNLTRAEFFAIKTAFRIVKTSMPFTPKFIDEHTAEEIAEHYRLKKKQYSLKIYDANKHKDIEQRIKQMDEVDYWYGRIIEESNKLQFEHIKYRPMKLEDESVVLIDLTDIHSGLVVKNVFNTYNPQIMSMSFQKLYANIIENVGCHEKVIICELGDTVHGIIHGSVYKYGGFMMEATFNVLKELSKLLTNLCKIGYTVEFNKVNGSHESIEKGKTDRTEEDNIGNLIYNLLKWKLSDIPNLTFIDNQEGLNIGIIPIYDYSICTCHGDNASLANLSKAERLFRKHNVTEVHCGHRHHRIVENKEGVTVLFNEPMCGTDQYAGNKFMSSEKGTRLTRYTKEGAQESWLCRY